MEMKQFHRLYASWALGLDERDAYELQRALQQYPQFLPDRPGRGRSAMADPFSVAFFLTAVLAGAGKANAVKHTSDFFDLPIAQDFDLPNPDETCCGLTGERRFGPAFQTIIGNVDLASRVRHITVERMPPTVLISHWETPRTVPASVPTGVEKILGDIRAIAADEVHETLFTGAPRPYQRLAERQLPGALVVTAKLGGEVIHQLAIDLADNAE